MGYNSKHLKVKLPKNTVTNLKKALGSKSPSFQYEIEPQQWIETNLHLHHVDHKGRSEFQFAWFNIFGFINKFKLIGACNKLNIKEAFMTT